MMQKRKESGVALIFALGILTLLLVLGVTFVLNMMAASRTASALEAQLAAEQAAFSGNERAIAELRLEMRPSAVATPAQRWFYADPNPSYRALGQSYSGALGTAPVSARYTLRLRDAASKIVVNDGNANLQTILEGLPGLDQITGGQTRAHWILDLRGRMPGGRFAKLDQILLATGMDEASTNAVKPFLTLQSYQDRSMLPGPRSPVNINTAAPEVLSAVLRPLLSDKAEADAVAAAIVGWRGAGTNGYFDAWRKYDTFINGLALPGLTDREKENLRDNASPNRNNIWDRSDAVNPVRPKPTTEFCFHSGGNYDMESLGESLGRAGAVSARVRWDSSIALNRILNITRRGDFAQSPEWYRVTWLDSCPVESTDDLDGGGYRNNYRRINDALKVGYWDNFDEDLAYSARMIANVGENPDAGYALQDINGDGDNEFHHTNANPANVTGNFGDFEISFRPAGQTVNSWDFRSFYAKAWCFDEAAHLAKPEAGAGDVGRLRFRQSGGAYGQAYGRNEGLLYIPNDPAKTGLPGKTTPAMAYEDPPQGSNLWVGRPQLLDERFTNFYLKEIDGSDFDLNLHNGVVPEATPAAGLGPCGFHTPAHTRYNLRITQGAVISDLADSGPDGRRPPNFLFSYNFNNEKWYRLFVIHRRADDTQGVRMEIADTAGSHAYPAGFGGELNTWMNPRGLFGIRNNGDLAAWDDLRVICPFGDYRSVTLDGGSDRGQWGSISWTRTIPASASLDTESITMDAISSVSGDMANPSMAWTFNMPGAWTDGVPPPLEPLYPVGRFTNEAGNDMSVSTLINQRFLQFRAYLGSTRPDADAQFCRQTPVLEDVTITYFPTSKITGLRRESP